MNCANVLTGVLRRGIKPVFASTAGLLAQQTRNTFILRRKYNLPLHKKNQKPPRFQHRYYIYELIENLNNKKKEPIDMILTNYVPGTGNAGDRIKMMPNNAYNKFLLPGLAVYASPENIEKYKEYIEKAEREGPTYSSPWVEKTMNYLSMRLLNVIVSKDNPWTVEKYHIRAGFRTVNIHVPDYAITMPERPITGPDLNKENKEFYITVTINQKEKVKVRCRLHHYTSKANETIYCKNFWSKPAPAIFPEDQPILDSMPRHKLCNDKEGEEEEEEEEKTGV